ncbi:MAG: hypothetical protein QUS08_01400, partial [Methanothrix sp.]|nr:hypothetical protein [Methanothrix sp.]
MKRLLIPLLLMAVAISGCMERGQEADVQELKARAATAAENLSTYSLESTMNQTLRIQGVGGNATSETSISESAETSASINLSGFQARATGSTRSVMDIPGQPQNASSSQAEVYQIGNSTYMRDERGYWTHLVDPRPAGEIWSSSNQVRTLAETLNQSDLEIVGTETVDGVEAYKLRIRLADADYTGLYNAAFGIAARLTQYPLFMPSINSTELNRTISMEKFVWISKESFLPVRYSSSMSFKMTPEPVSYTHL